MPDPMDTLLAAPALALSALAASAHAIRLLANNGLVSPEEVEEYADSLTQHLAASGLSAEGRMDLEAQIEALLGPALAEIRQTAARTYKGGA